MTDSYTFLRPEAAWLLAGAAVLLLLTAVLRPRRFVAVGTGSLLLARSLRASPLRHLPKIVVTGVLVLVVAALMEPVVPYSELQVESRGIDIVIALDLSVSMEELMGAKGRAPSSLTRLEVTKRAISDFVAGREGDRIGLVVFSEQAYVVSPLTLDHAYVQRYVALIDDQTLRSEGLTAIGEGLTVSAALLARQAPPDRARTGVIVLLTDGENTFGRDPIEALEEAHEAGYRVHLIGVDLEAKVKEAPQVRRLISRVQTGGGRYFVADTTGELTEASRAIDVLEKGNLVSRQIEYNAPAFAAFTAGALVLLCAGLLLRALPMFVDRT